ncbi:GtrA family protein [Sphingomicrobium lutaoense]|uniref:Putative flippase GtrA n=1 Tax=Sphingomicrobium lutaoense TaxID=515949 RepID=A0A839Z3L4_9SPHN|nr:GtrA family protein [Sphingomicrobium lutaoense]MBB3764677.1 putative flippase GtrA [Sphingomicrobium lutaoense]
MVNRGSIFDALPPDQRVVAGQVIRYAAAGLGITIAFSFAYWAIAEWGGVDPNLSLAIAFVLFSGIGYVIHGRFSFAGHGSRDRPLHRGSRFFIVNLAGFFLNQFWVWLLVKQMDGATWWPTLLFVLVTPWLTFALHRRFVYQ